MNGIDSSMHILSKIIHEQLEVKGEILINYQDGMQRGALLKKKNGYYYVINWSNNGDGEIVLITNKTNNDEFWKRKFSPGAFWEWIAHISGETPCYWNTEHHLQIVS